MRLKRDFEQFCASVLVIVFSCEALIGSACAESQPENLFSNYTHASRTDRQEFDHLISMCTDRSLIELVGDERGYQHAVVFTRDEENSRSIYPIDCGKLGIGPYLVNQNDIRQEKKCLVAGVEDPFEAQKKLILDLQYDARIKRCESTGTKILSSSCAKEMSCNIARSFLTLSKDIAYVSSFGNQKLMESFGSKSQESCLNSPQSNCLTTVVKSILQSLWSMVTDFPMAVYHLGQWVGTQFSKKTEANATQKMIIGSRTSDSQLKRFRSDPVKFVSDTVSDIMDQLMEKLSSTSTSVGRNISLGWKCSTCDGMLNGVCSIAGMIGTGLVISFVTGTIAGYLAKIATSGEEISKIEKIFKKMFEIAEKVEKSDPFQAAKEWVTTTGKRIKVIVDPIAKKIANNPILKKYAEINEKAFARGYFKNREAYDIWRDEHDVSITIDRVEHTRGFARKLSEEEKALVADQPYLFKGKLTPDRIEETFHQLRSEADEATKAFLKIEELSRTDLSQGEALAEKLALEALASSHNLASHLPAQQSNAILNAGVDRAKQLLGSVSGADSNVDSRFAKVRAAFEKSNSTSSNLRTTHPVFRNMGVTLDKTEEDEQ